MSIDNTYDTDYKLFNALIETYDHYFDGSNFDFDITNKFEVIIFLYAYIFYKLYESKPEYESVIHIRVQQNVFDYIARHADKTGFSSHIDKDIGDLINERASLYSDEFERMNSGEDVNPSNHLFSFLESSSDASQSDSFDLTKQLILQQTLIHPMSELNSVAKEIIDHDFNFAQNFKYNEIINSFKEGNDNIVEALEIILLNTDECKKLCLPSEISGGLPRGRDFIYAVKTIKKFENSKNYLLLGSLILFDKWKKSYTDKYRLPKEHLLFIEHQILQTYQQLS